MKTCNLTEDVQICVYKYIFLFYVFMAYDLCLINYVYLLCILIIIIFFMSLFIHSSV